MHSPKDADGGLTAFCAEERQAFGKQLGDRPGEQGWIIGAGEPVQVVEGQAAPGSAQNTQPGYPVAGIEQRTGQSQSVKDFGPGGELFEFNGAEGDCRFAKRFGDGSQ